ncbi:uncharacterized protein AMSG_07498 [Thecamonas trahens ATCC 50062]|uniref:Uncharacterized protein n=1 Tax=Thecamonas trahens ATCC 50062 TaxID=461836 RepID=A0A0L0DHL5_THETB|nr:hypothetical protein AMSG_07498 [Thecamonas trahens ATCC 50062]KNC51591.1 hypothetical protein AMSG_07498 [Thecamonas trahens ATCC 50062]|eukprot:XP_013755990.1 hypothetical protein AMSG_07498 [Thecamonas trahens ATCC 50062]
MADAAAGFGAASLRYEEALQRQVRQLRASAAEDAAVAVAEAADAEHRALQEALDAALSKVSSLKARNRELEAEAARMPSLEARLREAWERIAGLEAALDAQPDSSAGFIPHLLPPTLLHPLAHSMPLAQSPACHKPWPRDQVSQPGLSPVVHAHGHTRRPRQSPGLGSGQLVAQQQVNALEELLEASLQQYEAAAAEAATLRASINSAAAAERRGAAQAAGQREQRPPAKRQADKLRAELVLARRELAKSAAEAREALAGRDAAIAELRAKLDMQLRASQRAHQ